MATVKGVNQVLIDTGGVAGISNGIVNARVKAYHDQYVALGTELSGTLIKMCGALPAGAKIVGISLASDDLGSSVTLSVGDSNSSARYLSAVDAHTGRTYNALPQGGLGYVIGTNTGDTQILITTGGATLAAGTIKIVVLVSQD